MREKALQGYPIVLLAVHRYLIDNNFDTEFRKAQSLNDYSFYYIRTSCYIIRERANDSTIVQIYDNNHLFEIDINMPESFESILNTIRTWDHQRQESQKRRISRKK